ncbi:MAG TPA: RNA polymerase sigma factor FliA [Polyangiaceae bacterium]|nr:RNA polymerase sigma factor FliA [Polyangiaceae bacterium]
MRAPASAEERAHRSLDRDAYDHFLPMIRRTAMRFARRVPKHVTVADLVGYGWVGLMEAYQRCDPNIGPSEFEAYASYRVRGAMLDYLRSLDPMTRDLRRSSRKVTETIRTLTGENGRPPEEADIAAALDIEVPAYRELLERIAKGGMARLELLDVEHHEIEGAADNADDELRRKQLSARVAQAIEALPARQQDVLALYYQEECTLREIGAILGVSESRVSQIHSEAMHRLRALIGRN